MINMILVGVFTLFFLWSWIIADHKYKASVDEIKSIWKFNKNICFFFMLCFAFNFLWRVVFLLS